MHAPLTESAPPTRKAITALGILIVQNMESIIGSMPSGVPLPVIWPPIIPKRSFREIYTLPCLIASTRTKRHRTADITILSPVPFLVIIIQPFSLCRFSSENLLEDLILNIIEFVSKITEFLTVNSLAPLKGRISNVLVRT